MEIALVAALTRNRVIGRDGGMPWHIPGELRRFRALTWGQPVIMGRTTYASLGRPLPGRTTIVLSRQALDLPDGVLQARGPEAALDLARGVGGTRICIAGGGAVYRLYLACADALYLSEIDADTAGDVLFPPVPADAWAVVTAEHVPGTPSYTARVYRRVAKT